MQVVENWSDVDAEVVEVADAEVAGHAVLHLDVVAIRPVPGYPDLIGAATAVDAAASPPDLAPMAQLDLPPRSPRPLDVLVRVTDDSAALPAPGTRLTLRVRAAGPGRYFAAPAPPAEDAAE